MIRPDRFQVSVDGSCLHWRSIFCRIHLFRWSGPCQGAFVFTFRIVLIEGRVGGMRRAASYRRRVRIPLAQPHNPTCQTASARRCRRFLQPRPTWTKLWICR